jgi:hypothetical protein
LEASGEDHAGIAKYIACIRLPLHSQVLTSYASALEKKKKVAGLHDRIARKLMSGALDKEVHCGPVRRKKLHLF